MKYLLLSIATVIIFNTISIENKQEPVIIQEASASNYQQNNAEEVTNDKVIPNPTIESSSFNFQSFFTILIVLFIANGGCLLLAKKNDLLTKKNDLLPMNEVNKSNDMK